MYITVIKRGHLKVWLLDWTGSLVTGEGVQKASSKGSFKSGWKHEGHSIKSIIRQLRLFLYSGIMVVGLSRWCAHTLCDMKQRVSSVTSLSPEVHGETKQTWEVKTPATLGEYKELHCSEHYSYIFELLFQSIQGCFEMLYEKQYM